MMSPRAGSALSVAGLAEASNQASAISTTERPAINLNVLLFLQINIADIVEYLVAYF